MNVLMLGARAATMPVSLNVTAVILEPAGRVPVPESRGLGFGLRALLTGSPEPVEHFPPPRSLGIV